MNSVVVPDKELSTVSTCVRGVTVNTSKSYTTIYYRATRIATLFKGAILLTEKLFYRTKLSLLCVRTDA